MARAIALDLAALVLLTLLVCAAPTATAGAQRADDLEALYPPRAGDPSWRDLVSPERARGRDILRRGLERLLAAYDAREDDPITPRREQLLEEALVRFERARRYLGDEPALVYYEAMAYALYRQRGPDGHVEDRHAEAIEAFQRLRAIAPDYEPARVAVELAVLHTRDAAFAQAAAEYRRALAEVTLRRAHAYDPSPREQRLDLLFSPPSEDDILANLAEVTMLSGDVAGALPLYARAIEVTRDDALANVLARWGMALALVRAGRVEEALIEAHAAVQRTPVLPPRDADPALVALQVRHGAMWPLHSPFVFFEPENEVLAYDGIGHEAMALHATTEEARDEHTRLALLAWQAYLMEGGASSPFAGSAEASVRRLEAALGAPE